MASYSDAKLSANGTIVNKLPAVTSLVFFSCLSKCKISSSWLYFAGALLLPLGFNECDGCKQARGFFFLHPCQNENWWSWTNIQLSRHSEDKFDNVRLRTQFFIFSFWKEVDVIHLHSGCIICRKIVRFFIPLKKNKR